MLLPFFLEEIMPPNGKPEAIIKKEISVEDVNRVLDIGRILFSVLTTEEIEELEICLSHTPVVEKLGNTSVS
jgi:hypothetical protein